MGTARLHSNWYEANQAYLGEYVSMLGLRLAGEDSTAAEAGLAEFESGMEHPPMLRSLVERFGLSVFEADLLMLTAALELEGSFSGLCANAHGDSRQTAPTFSLALVKLREPHWSAISPSAPLRRWRLVEVGAGSTLMSSPLKLDERILHYLTGLSTIDERLRPYVSMAPGVRHLTESQRALAIHLSESLRQTWQSQGGGVMGLAGSDDEAQLQIAAQVGSHLGMPLYALRAADIPTTVADRDSLARLWEREALLQNAALLVRVDGAEDAKRQLQPFLADVRGIVMLTSREPIPLGGRPVLRADVARLAPAEQEAAWQRSLGPYSAQLNGSVRQMVSQFEFGLGAIEAAGNELTHLNPSDETAASALWEICRRRARTRLDDLAQRVETRAGWDDLVLPPEQIATLRDVATHVRQRFQVYEVWGFAGKGARGLGISALFTGASGTGKTLAAEVLASELHLDLYRIDLSSVVSKYIGETEKNLRRLFDAAEEGGAVLLFDEADALFGKRSEVKDSHDRYANIEVSYLLQRMEAYRGLAILTTNLKSALDNAFLRRLRFVVQFPFPDSTGREAIWRRIFPAGVPQQDLDFERLAYLNVSGGSIRNIALGAAFSAADMGAPLGMRHLLEAARAEYRKLEKPMADSEVGGWTF